MVQGNPNSATIQTGSIPDLIDTHRLMQLQAEVFEEMIDLMKCFDVIADQNNIDFVIPTLGKGTVSTDVNELENTLIKTAAWGAVAFSIKKDVGHVAESDEAKMRMAAGGINNMEMQLKQNRQAFVESNTDRLVKAIMTKPQTYTAKMDWAVDADNPSKDLAAASNKLKFGNKRNKYIVLHPDALADIATNEKFVKYATIIDKATSSTYSLVEDTTETINVKKAYLCSGAGAGIYISGKMMQESYRDVNAGADAAKITFFNGVSPAIRTVGAGLNAGVVEITLK